MILNFSPPTAPVQNTYTAPTRTNPYLTSSQYEGMQLHIPSGLYYQGGTVYEPYTPPAPRGWMYGMYNPNTFNPNLFGMRQDSKEADKIIKIGNQSFKPFTGNAEGIINGNLSMVSMLNKQPTLQPQGIPSNLFNFLSSPAVQQATNQDSSGAGRFTGLLGSPITTNTQGK